MTLKRIGNSDSFEDTQSGRRDLTEAEKRAAIEERYGRRVTPVTEPEKAQAYLLYREKHGIK
jgi:hypothetical protein